MTRNKTTPVRVKLVHLRPNPDHNKRVLVNGLPVGVVSRKDKQSRWILCLTEAGKTLGYSEDMTFIQLQYASDYFIKCYGKKRKKE